MAYRGVVSAHDARRKRSSSVLALIMSCADTAYGTFKYGGRSEVAADIGRGQREQGTGRESYWHGRIVGSTGVFTAGSFNPENFNCHETGRSNWTSCYLLSFAIDHWW
jgi:hypothetical protein